jgi:hypothetical protein
MKLGIMQPYFFPYIGYFSLIAHVDKFVLLDEVQFIRHGWIERNRVLKPDGWQYIKVPLVKSPRDTKISGMEMREEAWRHKILAQLVHYKKRAPHYEQAIEIVTEALAIETNSITKLNSYGLRVVCDFLGIDTPIEVFTEMDLEIEPVEAADEWALTISKAMGASEYINPPSGRDIFDPEKYNREGIVLKFLTNNLTPYNQRRPEFMAGLSIVDVLMFNDQQAAKALVDDYTLD